MIRRVTIQYFQLREIVLFLCLCLLFATNVFGGDVASAPKMPGHWKVITDAQVPMDQVNAMSSRLGANLISVRNTIYDVNGKRVQINTIAAIDPENAEKLMAKLRSMKSEEALLRKNLIIYEFVGQNDVLTVIAEGRRYLESM